MTVRLAVLLISALLAVACASDASAPGPRASAAGEAAPDPLPGERPVTPRSPAPTVAIDRSAVALMNRFVNTPSVLVADHVRIDMSRKPFLSATTFSFSPAKVKRTDNVDGERGVLTITLQNLFDVGTVITEVPRVRIRDGLEVVGTDKIVLRYWTAQDPERPIFFEGVGAGTASYVVEGTPNKRYDGRTVTLNAQTTRTSSGYRFDQAVEAKP